MRILFDLDPNYGKKCFLKFWNKLIERSYRTIYKACDYVVSAVRYLTDIQYKKIPWFKNSCSELVQQPSL